MPGIKTFNLLPLLTTVLRSNPRIPLVRVSALGLAVIVGAFEVFAVPATVSLFRFHRYPPIVGTSRPL